ncbi:MAG: hypothetical protein ACI7YS_02225 [Flavobacterium sp.]
MKKIYTTILLLLLGLTDFNAQNFPLFPPRVTTTKPPVTIRATKDHLGKFGSVTVSTFLGNGHAEIIKQKVLMLGLL